MSRAVCGICMCPYGDDGGCACGNAKPAQQQQHVCTVGSHWNGGKGFQVENFTGEAPPYGTKLYTAPPTQQALCRDDGRCQYAIDHGAEGLGHCPKGKCCMPKDGVQALREAAFDKGFLLAASWAGRDDLNHDQGSRAYLEERDAALRGEMPTAPDSKR